MSAIDVFLSHARADRDSYALPLAEACRDRCVSVWVDEAQIRPGESLTDALGRGLDRARFVLVLLTENFLSRNWTATELRNALSKEGESGRQILLPVFVADREAVIAKFPLLRDKVGLMWEDGVETVAQRISDLFNRRPSRWWTHTHANDHLGPVWIRVCPQSEYAHEEHLFEVVWGPLQYTRVLHFNAGRPQSLTHHKIGRDAVTLHVRIEPDAIVTFGESAPPDRQADVLPIDEGWIRIPGSPLVRARTIDDLGEDPGDWVSN